MLQKLFNLLRKKESPFSKHLKELSISRQDLVRHLPEIDIDSPVNAYITLAILLKEKGEYYKSLKILEKLKGESLSEDEQKLLYLNLALTYRAAGFLDRAERALKEGISLFPSEGLFYYELALIYKVSNRLEEAVNLLEKAVELKGEFFDELVHTKLYLADNYIDRGRTDQAFRLIRKLDIRVPVPLFYYVMSKLYYAVGEREKGYRKAIQGMKLSPGHVAPFLRVIEENEGLSTDKLYEIIKETGMLSITGKLLAEKLIEEGRKEEAFRILEKLNENYGSDVKIKEIYLRLLWESGKRKQVVEEIERFLLDLKKRKKEFKCRNCGYETNTFDWICPRCRQWETLEIGSED